MRVGGSLGRTRTRTSSVLSLPIAWLRRPTLFQLSYEATGISGSLKLNFFSFRAVSKWNLPACWFVFDRISVWKLNVQSIFSSLKFPNCSTLYEHNSIVFDVYQRNKHLFALSVFDFYCRYPGGATNLSEPLVDLVLSKIMNERLDRLACCWKDGEEGKKGCKKKCSHSISVKIKN